MKKHLQSAGILLLTMLLLWMAPAGAQGESSSRKLTLMVYMCGSNLESGYGSASDDLQEMLAAGISSDVSVLVMTGGSGSWWQAGYDAAQIRIVEIGSRGSRVVWTDEKMNMGDPATLTKLLTFGAENRPAEEYALILWDHGGGPVEGVCWDELFSMDHLSLPELKGALDAANLGQKMKWIGFDACLMSSLEVASALAPYAEYMIASQETEPSFGWNYAFLNGIGEDRTGADTGRRIVDAYFEDHLSYQDIMTLSCLDLSKAAEAEAEMDAFFADPDLTVTPETFARVSNLRGEVKGIGKAVRASGDDGYDLVDARGLIAALGPGNAAAEKLSALLEEMVVCTRDNENGMGGVSLYHPYANKKKYLEKWREEYDNLHFSPGYSSYIRSFGDALTAQEQTDWSGLATGEAGFGRNLENLFTLQMTAEQRENFASAQLLVLNDLLTQQELADHCALVYTGQASLNAQGEVTAEYTGKALYIELEDGTLYGPVAFGRTRDGQFVYNQMIYLPEGTRDISRFGHVVYYLDAESDEEYPEIIRTRVWDPATESFTNRIYFDENQYSYIHLYENGRVFPDADGPLPMYEEWEDGSALIGGLDITLPNRWRFRWVEDPMDGRQLYAMFQITDVQQNVFCSAPVPVRNPYLQDFTGILEMPDPVDFDLSVSARITDSPMERDICFRITLANGPADAKGYRFTQLTLNGERLSASTPFRITPQEEESSWTTEVMMRPEELFGLDQIETVSFTVTVSREDGSLETPVTVRLDGCDVRALCRDIQPLAEAEQEGARMQLLSLEPYLGSGIRARVLVENGREESLYQEKNAVIGGLELDGSGFLNSSDLPAGKSILREYTLRNDLMVSGEELEVMDEMGFFYSTYVLDHLLQHQGISQISELTFYCSTDGWKDPYQEPFVLRLEEPWALRDGEVSTYLNTSIMNRNPEEDPDQPAGKFLLAEDDAFTVNCVKVLAGKTGVTLGLEITNRTDRMLTVYSKSLTLNGQAAEVYYLDMGEWQIAPGMVRMVALTLEGNNIQPALQELRTVGFGLESREQRESGQEGASCLITLMNPQKMGEFKATWIEPDQMN